MKQDNNIVNPNYLYSNDKYQFIDAQFDEALKDQEATIRVAALKFAESYAASMVSTNEGMVRNKYLILRIEKK